MSSDYEILGLSPGASLDEIRTAYHAKLKEFPAHRFPQEFKMVRAAYENLKQCSSQPQANFLEWRNVAATIPSEASDRLREQARQRLALPLRYLLQQTF